MAQFADEVLNKQIADNHNEWQTRLTNFNRSGGMWINLASLYVTLKNSPSIIQDAADETRLNSSALAVADKLKADMAALTVEANVNRTNINAEADTALTDYDPPTNAEMEARTLAAADYFDPTSDTVANVTTVGTCTTNTDMRGTDNALLASTWNTVMSGITSLAQWLGLMAGKQTGNSTARTEIRATGAGSGAFDETTDSLEAIRDRGDATWITATGFSTLSAADVNAEVVDVLRTDTIPDSYSTDGNQPTIAQALLEVHQWLMERSVSGTTVTVKKPDGSTTAMTFTLDDGTSPTSITRAT